jgi:hypothetical protein
LLGPLEITNLDQWITHVTYLTAPDTRIKQKEVKGECKVGIMMKHAESGTAIQMDMLISSELFRSNALVKYFVRVIK